MKAKTTNHIASIDVPRRFVETVEHSGAKVFVQHYRWVTTKPITCERYLEHVTDKNHNQFVVESKGGLTKVQVVLKDGRKLEGESICSEMDNYDKKLGTYLAIKRAFGQINPILADKVNKIAGLPEALQWKHLRFAEKRGIFFPHYGVKGRGVVLHAKQFVMRKMFSIIAAVLG